MAAMQIPDAALELILMFCSEIGLPIYIRGPGNMMIAAWTLAPWMTVKRTRFLPMLQTSWCAGA